MGKEATLLSPQQWRFVDAVIKGASYSKAYARAGYKVSTPSAAEVGGSKLVRNPKVEAAIAATRRAAGARSAITLDTIIERLERCMEIALTVDPPQVSAGVAAVMGQAKVLGLVIDRSQLDITLHKPAPYFTKALELTESEWLKQFEVPKDPALPGKKSA